MLQLLPYIRTIFMFVWDGWGLVPYEGPVNKLLDFRHLRLKLIWFCTQVLGWNLAGWRTLVPQRSWDWGLLILQVCLCVLSNCLWFEGRAGTHTHPWNASNCCCNSYGDLEVRRDDTHQLPWSYFRLLHTYEVPRDTLHCRAKVFCHFCAKTCIHMCTDGSGST